MPNGVWALALSAAMQVGAPGPSETPNYPALQNAYNQYGFEGQYEQRFQFDSQQNWVHGYFQEIPAYGGYAHFRPNNYKDILSQSQVSAGWGHSPVLPYSQQFWHKYHDQATMLRLSRLEGGMPQAPAVPAPAMFVPTAGSYLRQPGVYYGSVPLPPSPAEAYPPQALPLTPETTGPSLPGPVLQPAVGERYVDPAGYAPR